MSIAAEGPGPGQSEPLPRKPEEAASGGSGLSQRQVHPGDKTVGQCGSGPSAPHSCRWALSGVCAHHPCGGTEAPAAGAAPQQASSRGSRSRLSKELWELPEPHSLALEPVAGREVFHAPDSSRRLLPALVLRACDRFLREGPWGGGAPVSASATARGKCRACWSPRLSCGPHEEPGQVRVVQRGEALSQLWGPCRHCPPGSQRGNRSRWPSPEPTLAPSLRVGALLTADTPQMAM